MNRFRVTDAPLGGLKVVERTKIGDARGFLARIFCTEELFPHGWESPIAQINHTLTEKAGTVRGIHFQLPPHAETKLVTCLHGKVWDVAVDLRQRSPTFLQWHAELLSEENGRALLIPAGFGHGFQALSDAAELLYCHSAAYAPLAEGGLNPLDPLLVIGWPLAISELSMRDQSRPMLTSKFEGIVL